jgi:hypothetical protein
LSGFVLLFVIPQTLYTVQRRSGLYVGAVPSCSENNFIIIHVNTGIVIIVFSRCSREIFQNLQRIYSARFENARKSLCKKINKRSRFLQNYYVNKYHALKPRHGALNGMEKHKPLQMNITVTILDIIHRPVFYLKLNSTL